MAIGNLHGGIVGLDDVTGTPGNDHLTGTAAGDTFDVSQGGHDSVRGLDGNDTVSFGVQFEARDRVFGGAGDDTVILNGNYSLLTTLGDHAFTSIETLTLQGAFSYALAFGDTNVAAHHTLGINSSGVDAAHSVFLDGFAETDGGFAVVAGAGNDTVLTGGGNDFALLGMGNDRAATSGGNDTFLGGDGTDRFEFYGDGTLDGHDSVDGGDGDDVVALFGNYATHQVIAATTFSSVEAVYLEAGYSFDLDFSHSGLSEAAFTTIDDEFNDVSHTLTFTAHGETGFGYEVHGGAGDDTITGSAGRDRLIGGGGADRLTGGDDTDNYIWNALSDSQGTHYDTIVGLDARADFLTVGNVADVDDLDRAVRRGTLRSDDFNADLAAAVAGHLDAGDAILFRPDAGGLKGEWFLIVDANGQAGYQANQDLVVHLENPLHISELTEANFVDDF